jgi:flagellar hook-length control protein FliK
MNATNRPVDVLLNIESPSINLAQRRGTGQSSSQSSELSALNRKENSFEDVYRQQRRDDNEVRQPAQQKRSAEQSSHHENRSIQAQQNAPIKQSRAETKATSDGKALPHSAPSNHGQDDVSVVARKVAETTTGEEQTSDLELAQGVEVTVKVDGSELVVDDDSNETVMSSAQQGDESLAEDSADFVPEVIVEVGASSDTEADVKLAENVNTAQADAEQQSDSQQGLSTEDTVVLQSQQAEAVKQQAAFQSSDTDVKARAAQASAVAAEVSREFKQSRLNETIEGVTKGEVNTAMQTKVTGAGGEQTGQQVPQDRLAQLTAVTDFKVLREQLAAGTVKLDAGVATGAKGASADALSAADSAGDRQPRLNALTQASQALAQAKPGVVSASVQQSVGSPEWGQAMSQRIMWLANRGISSAELQLNPRDMGPVDVRINVSGEQTTVQFSSQNAAVREALESSVVRLREMMESSGLDLTDVDVSDQSQSEQAQADGDDTSGRTAAGEKDELDGVAESGVTARIETDGLVDFYA